MDTYWQRQLGQDFTESALNLTPHTLKDSPFTLHLTSYTSHPTPYTITRCTLHSTPYTLHPTPYILQEEMDTYWKRQLGQDVTEKSEAIEVNPQPSTLNPQPSTLHPQPSTRDSKPETRNPKPKTRNPNPEIRNPGGGSRAPPRALHRPARGPSTVDQPGRFCTRGGRCRVRFVPGEGEISQLHLRSITLKGRGGGSHAPP